MKNVQLLSKKILDLISEVETYSFYKANFQKSLRQLFVDYQQGKYDYSTYEHAKKKLLKGATEEEWIKYYDAYVLALFKRIEAYNNQIFYETYHDNSYVSIKATAPKPLPKLTPAPEPPKLQEIPDVIKEKARAKVKPVFKERIVSEMEAPSKLPQEVLTKPTAPVAPTEEELLEEPDKKLETKAEKTSVAVDISTPSTEKTKKSSFIVQIKSLFGRIGDALKLSSKRSPSAVEETEKQIPETAEKHKLDKSKSEKYTKHHTKHVTADSIKKTLQSGMDVPEKDRMDFSNKKPAKPVVKPKRHFLQFLFKKPRPMLKPLGAKGVIKDKEVQKGSNAVVMQGFSGFSVIKRILGLDKSQKVEFSEGSEIGRSTLQLENLRRQSQVEIDSEIEKITATALTKEASRIKTIMERRKSLKIYHPSFFGSLANLTIKRISLYLLDTFPEFFKDLYHALRLANIKVLSNTYVNMMVLGVVVSFFVGLFVMGIFFGTTGLPISQIIFRTIMMSALVALAAFAGFYSYPYSKMKQRRRSINANLPFAINHMSAVASSGVSPTKMFELISQSKEYGEISAEIEKIVNYIELFGYDILTALKSVSATTPSEAFKEFFEGMISTTQTGGDIKSYLGQKSEDAMMNYKLERQKYTETISTYSDIYTGILIAAPLFFVAALSLVSLLGGKIGGINVNVVIVLGTYVVIPILNIGFLSFLEITQPEI